MFDPPVGGAPLARATRLAIAHRAGSDASALLMLAWIGVLLDWRPLRSVQTSDGGSALRLRSRAAQPVTGNLVPADGPCGRSGILGVELGSAGRRERYTIRRTAMDQAVLQTPRVPARPVKLDSPSDAELCVAALGSRGRDPLFARCLGYARQLWSLEPEPPVAGGSATSSPRVLLIDFRRRIAASRHEPSTNRKTRSFPGNSWT